MRRFLRIFKVIFVGIMLTFLFFAGSMPVLWAASNGETSSVKLNAEFRNDSAVIDEMERSPSNPILVVLPVVASCVFVIAALAVGMIRYKNAVIRMRDEKSLIEKKKEQLQSLVENSDDGVFILKKLKFIYANKRVYEMMGVSPGDSLSNNLKELSAIASKYINKEKAA